MDPGAQAAQIKFNLTKWWKRSWMLRKTYLKPVPTTAVGASISNCPTTFYQADYEHHQKNEDLGEAEPPHTLPLHKFSE